ncbi:RNA polymerase sigma-70 factor (ECF subfamily) [Parabacteroides sp. PH5-13]|uniref:RNA polymerase sigma-70 factor n=1 Tax=unclassified Parabacteroides TaxID=2649774 RepID=UPI002472FA61|nr:MULTISPECIES: RNA polymerase sigma-70 factor [unclassified Parabacteroides]MDH6306456.1 RNA polymerase sigma-70 factor (ECF subfamily) [Parabacteroides sp. PH5-39]MDH6321167.1 RNA polymerase sigma-70 factor (ECF subfamily) [Parabacteroides sp. PH5-13]
MTDLNAFNQLFTDYQGRFIRFANTYVRDLAVAEDFTMEALMYYWENRHSIKQDSNIPAYILTTIKHKCLNYLQHLQIREQAAGTIKDHAAWELQTRISTLEACDPDELFSAEAMEIVRNTLKAMSERTREIFVMSRYQNKTYKEIASRLHITEKGVEFHISKALKLLRHHLKDYLPVFVYLFL